MTVLSNCETVYRGRGNGLLDSLARGVLVALFNYHLPKRRVGMNSLHSATR
jgi:hypothetical protein